MWLQLIRSPPALGSQIRFCCFFFFYGDHTATGDASYSFILLSLHTLAALMLIASHGGVICAEGGDEADVHPHPFTSMHHFCIFAPLLLRVRCPSEG